MNRPTFTETIQKLEKQQQYTSSSKISDDLYVFEFKETYMIVERRLNRDTAYTTEYVNKKHLQLINAFNRKKVK